MNDPFFEFFRKNRNSISQNLYGEEPEPFKEYPDLPKIDLPQTDVENTELYQLLNARESAIGYSQECISLEVLTNILKLSAGTKHGNSDRRMYPSGGAKYPTEVYVAGIRVNGLDKAIYHYNPRENFLTVLKTLSTDELMRCFPHNNSSSALFEAAAIVFLTFSKGRSIKKYGEFAYKLGLIEAGHIGQNFYLSSQINGVGCRVHSGEYSDVHTLLDIDGIGETLVYTVSLGVKKDLLT